MRLILPLLVAAFCLTRPALASDAKSFFAYLREIAQEVSVVENGRESRQLTVTFPLTISLSGVSNFTFPVANIPTTFPISCGGDDRNYCNYPDLPLLETYDLNYYSRRPIPSGRCPDGYLKMPTFDCLNIAPALFETTCCVYMSSAPDVCASTPTIDAMFTLCNGSVYVTSGAYAWRLDSTLTVRQGPIMLAALTGGAISRDLAEAEVDGNCNVQFFNMADQYWVTNFADGSLSTSGPFLVTNLCLPGTPGLVFGAGSRGSNVYKIDGDSFVMVLNDGYNFQCGDNTTCSISVVPPGCLNQSPQINATAATYLPDVDLIVVVLSNNTVIYTTRNGTCLPALTKTLNLCTSTTTGATSAPVNMAPIVYIPYPVYPVFQPSGGNGNNGGNGGNGGYGSGSGSYGGSGGSGGGGSGSYGGSSGGGSSGGGSGSYGGSSGGGSSGGYSGK